MEITDQDQQHEEGLASDANHCFVCGQSNPIGLKVTFRIEDDICRGEFTPHDEHVGYSQVTHGGIVFSLLDDVMANWLWLRGEHSFTAKADIRYRAELPIHTPVRLEGQCRTRKGRLTVMEGRIIGVEDDFVYAEATASFMRAAG